MKQELWAALEALYEQVPEAGCKGLCSDFCGPIRMGPLERLRTRQAGVKITPEAEAKRKLEQSDGAWSCDALARGRCTIYPERPMICRTWGAAEGQECPYGCRPQNGLLPRAEAFALLDAAMKLGTVEQPIPAREFERLLRTARGEQAFALMRAANTTRKGPQT